MSSPTPDARSVFGRAAEIPFPTERAEFLDQACAGQSVVRAKVDALLKARSAAGSFMGSPAAPDDLTGAYESPISESEGTVTGPYTLREQIGEGRMGLVFVAEQSEPLDRFVTVKLINAGMDRIKGKKFVWENYPAQLKVAPDAKGWPTRPRVSTSTPSAWRLGSRRSSAASTPTGHPFRERARCRKPAGIDSRDATTAFGCNPTRWRGTTSA